MNGLSGGANRAGIEKTGVEKRGLPVFMQRIKRWEWWFGKVGIALLLFGVAFLFKYSWDQGWLKVLLTPAVRVGLGLTIGCGLIFLGLRVYEVRRAYARVFLGGGVATLYMSGFASFGIYEMLPYAVAFAFMVCLTAFSFALSLRQSEPSLAMIAVSGGLATPFLLYVPAENLLGLVLYTSGILVGASAIYLFKGWAMLLMTASTGTWLVFSVAYLERIYLVGSLLDQVTLQLGVIFVCITLSGVTLARIILRHRRPQNWPAPELGIVSCWLSHSGVALRDGTLAHIFAGTMPLVGLLFTQGIWNLSSAATGIVVFATAAIYAIAALILRNLAGGRALAYTHGLVATMLGVLGTGMVFEGDVLLPMLAAEATVLHLAGWRLRDRLLTGLAHGLFAVVLVWFEVRLLSGTVAGILNFGVGSESYTPAFFGVRSVVDLTVIALAFAVSAKLPLPVARAYRIMAHAGVLGILGRELLFLPNGDTYVFGAWGIYALALHGLSRRSPTWSMSTGAHALAGFVSVWLLARLVAGYVYWISDGYVGGSVLNLSAVADLVVLLLAGAAALLVSGTRTRAAYRIAACGGFSLLLLRELSTFDTTHGYVLLAWMIFAGAVGFAASRMQDSLLLLAARVQMAAVSVLLVARVLVGLIDGPMGVPIVVFQSLVDLSAIFAVAVSSRFVSQRKLRLPCGGFAHVALLAWFWRELVVLPNGDAYVTIAWGLYASSLLVVGLRLDHSWIARGGMVTLFLVAGKLLVWDLAGVEPIWRSLLCIGFGGLFLALGYYLQSLWKPSKEPSRLLLGPGDEDTR